MFFVQPVLDRMVPGEECNCIISGYTTVTMTVTLTETLQLISDVWFVKNAQIKKVVHAAVAKLLQTLVSNLQPQSLLDPEENPV